LAFVHKSIDDSFGTEKKMDMVENRSASGSRSVENKKKKKKTRKTKNMISALAIQRFLDGPSEDEEEDDNHDDDDDDHHHHHHHVYQQECRDLLRRLSAIDAAYF
jgi:hypothetical protein